MTVTWVRNNVLVLDDVLSDDELRALCDASESGYFDIQELGRGLGYHRARFRAQVESNVVAEILWRHLSEFTDPLSKWLGTEGPFPGGTTGDDWNGHSCNPRSRFYQYEIGGNFSEHEDEPWVRSQYVRSFLTVLVYLPTEERCIGGETVVDGDAITVVPGRIALFPHSAPHEGRPVERGQKLVLRNDVLFEAMSTLER